MHRRALLAGIALAFALVPACIGDGNNGGCDGGCHGGCLMPSGSSGSSRGTVPDCRLGCPEGCPQPFRSPRGATRGIRPDGRVDVTAQAAWPERPPTQQLLSPEEVAAACAALAACFEPVSVSDAGLQSTSLGRSFSQSTC